MLYNKYLSLSSSKWYRYYVDINSNIDTENKILRLMLLDTHHIYNLFDFVWNCKPTTNFVQKRLPMGSWCTTK